MSDNRSWDGLQFTPLELPYDKIVGALQEDPARLVAGLNAYVPQNGNLGRRPGTLAMTNGTLNFRVDRTWIYETMDTPPSAYAIASVFTGTTWALYYQH